MIRRTAALALALVLLLLGPAATAQTRERVAFPSTDPSFQGQLAALLYRPAGSGPFPAMILLHNCYGVQPFLDGYASWFVTQGYAAIVVESFGPRHAKDCNALPNLRLRAMDAYGALAYLRRRSDIDPVRIGVIGWSHGGGGAFLADSRRFSDDYSAGRPLRAVIGMYPVCLPDVQMIAAPLLVLQGAADDFSPPTECLGAVDRLNSDTVAATMHVYPGVTHAFDNRTLQGKIQVDGVMHTIVYDAKAAQDARERIREFLARNFKE
jgi:dienelactone hydrolase